jgi:capsular polysaccharide transport system permease protein
VAQSLSYSRPLLAYPSVTFVDAILARFTLNFLTELMVAYIVFTGIILLFDTRVILDFPSLGLAMALTGALALGIGMLNCFLMTAFPLWQQAWSILMRPMFILSGTMFIYDTIPEPARDWFWYNPLIHVIGLTRRGIYASYDAPYASPLYVLGVAGVCGLMGLLLLRRYHRLILQR